MVPQHIRFIPTGVGKNLSRSSLPAIHPRFIPTGVGKLSLSLSAVRRLSGSSPRV